MSKTKYELSVNTLNRYLCKASIVLGNVLTLIGCLGLVSGLAGLLNLDDFAIGISSGIRMISTIAIAGCLLSAIGYGFLDCIEK
jgi:hypothetical protein